MRKREFSIQISSGGSNRIVSQFAIPLLFVVLWSTGFIGAKFGLPYAEPFTFLSLRMGLTLAVLLLLALVFAKKRIGWPAIGHSIVTGLLVHASYLGAIFYAISNGMSAGVAALVVAIQPLVTTFIARPMLGEKTPRAQLWFLFLALFGVLLVLSPRLTGGDAADGINSVNVACVCFAVLAISIGAVYQKKYVPVTDLFSNTAAQFLGALIPMVLFSFAFETREVTWSGEFIFALLWLVFVLSIGAISILMFLIGRDSATQTASLFYLVPVSTSIIAYFLFGETLSIVQLIGMAIVVFSVANANRNAKKKIKK